MRVRSDRTIRRGYQQPPGHAQVHNPLGLGFCGAPLFKAAVYRTEGADNMFSNAFDTQDGASLKPLGLVRLRCLKGFPVRPEPRLHDAVPAHPLVDTAGNRLHLRQLRHGFIVEDRIVR